jgi:FkbM family methyltransferase
MSGFKKKFWCMLRDLKAMFWQQESYSQCGEDILVAMALNSLKIKRPVYLDIGAHHAKLISNTYLFYKRGSHGVLVEPDPVLFWSIKRARRRDICLNVGVGSGQNMPCDFYMMTSSVLSTFSKSEAERSQSFGKGKIEQVIKIPILNINDIIKRYFKGGFNYVSIDTEGFDLQIIQSFNFMASRPEVFCIETVTCDEVNKEHKLPEIITFMQKNGYFLYADTYINSIFVDQEAWNSRLRL